MDLNFEIFMIVLLVLSIVVVGNFLRDGESNYLEGALLMVSCVVCPDPGHSNNDRLDCLLHHCCCGVVLSKSRCSDVQRGGTPLKHLNVP
jgi:hypothetical protein